ncbi:MAG: response regulator [Bryobacteraceae bacterium]
MSPKIMLVAKGAKAVSQNNFQIYGTGEGASQNLVRVLLVSPFDEDHQVLQDILRHSKWEQYAARTRKEALKVLRKESIPVAICESELPDGDWKDLLNDLGGARKAPELVVTSRLADEVLWSEALHLGAYNVLTKPFDMQEVFHVVSLAWLHWKNQWDKPARVTSVRAAASYCA